MLSPIWVVLCHIKPFSCIFVNDNQLLVENYRVMQQLTLPELLLIVWLYSWKAWIKSINYLKDITSRTAAPTISPPSSSNMPAGSSRIDFPTGTLTLGVNKKNISMIFIFSMLEDNKKYVNQHLNTANKYLFREYDISFTSWFQKNQHSNSWTSRKYNTWKLNNTTKENKQIEYHLSDVQQ